MYIIVQNDKGQVYLDEVEAVARKGDLIIFDGQLKKVKLVVWYPDYDYIKPHYITNKRNITAFILVE